MSLCREVKQPVELNTNNHLDGVVKATPYVYMYGSISLYIFKEDS